MSQNETESKADIALGYILMSIEDQEPPPPVLREQGRCALDRRRGNTVPDFFLKSAQGLQGLNHPVSRNRAYCAHCNVRTECIDYATRSIEKGWWGSSERERLDIRAGRLTISEVEERGDAMARRRLAYSYDPSELDGQLRKVPGASPDED